MNNEDIQNEQEEVEKTTENIEESVEDNEDTEESEDFGNETFTYSTNNNSNQSYDDKKSFLYIAAGVIALILIIVVLVIVANKSKSGSFKYSDIESKMVSAAKNYYEKNSDLLPTMDGSSISITADTLIENSFLKPFSEMVDEGISCSGNVDIYKNGEDYAYFPYLDCGETYVSLKLSSELIKNVVTSGDGLYKIGDEYVFRGEYPNNYVTFSGKSWRIVKINSDGSIKLIYTEEKTEKSVWDDRYNSEKNGYVGINDFRKSRILDHLQSIYDNNSYFEKDNKTLLVKEDWCIGSITQGDTLISTLDVCSDVYSDLYIGLINVSEVLAPSLDSDCNSLYDVQCTNYNYFFTINTGWTLNSVKDNTYSVYSSDSGMASFQNASITSYLRPVINVNGDVLYKSGAGTKEEPYLIGD